MVFKSMVQRCCIDILWVGQCSQTCAACALQMSCFAICLEQACLWLIEPCVWEPCLSQYSLALRSSHPPSGTRCLAVPVKPLLFSLLIIVDGVMSRAAAQVLLRMLARRGQAVPGLASPEYPACVRVPPATGA